jgi:lipoprotein-anchoring transpeptidase ErfK/SrfK
MKPLYWLIGSAAILIVVVIGLIVVVSSRERCSKNPDIANARTIELPQSEADLRRELPKVRRALDRLQPSQPYIVIDTHANYIYLRTADSVIFRAPCSTGSGGELTDSTIDRRWVFNTPHGLFELNKKTVNPWWRKPDWAYVEENEAIPKDPRERFDPDMLGDYALGFGNGYFIHGTLYERLLGINVTHGCVRVGAENLKFIYDRARIGTPIYIF